MYIKIHLMVCTGAFPCCMASPHAPRIIRKTCPCNEYPLKPHFCIVKLGFAGVYLFFLFLLQNIDCEYSLEPPRLSIFDVKKILYIIWTCFRNDWQQLQFCMNFYVYFSVFICYFSTNLRAIYYYQSIYLSVPHVFIKYIYMYMNEL